VATKLSICTTNYNCAHSLAKHLDSVYRRLEGFEFEYVIVDNKSTDDSWGIIQNWARNFPNMKIASKRCTMGAGRQFAFMKSEGSHIMILDTDVVYSEFLQRFVEVYLEHHSMFSLQAIFCGLFPRRQWIVVGGRRNLNTNEDVDMWIRLWRLGTMRWYPVPMGDHQKEPWAEGSADYRSLRYPKRERVLRLLRREWDFFKTRKLESLDLAEIIAANTIDVGIGPRPGVWPTHRTPRARTQHIVEFGRELKTLIRRP